MVKIKGKQTSEQDGLVGMAPEGSPFGVPCIPFLLVENPFLQSQVRANASAWYFTVCLQSPLTFNNLIPAPGGTSGIRTLTIREEEGME